MATSFEIRLNCSMKLYEKAKLRNFMKNTFAFYAGLVGVAVVFIGLHFFNPANIILAVWLYTGLYLVHIKPTKTRDTLPHADY